MQQPKRPKRNPLSAEEVAEILALRKKREHMRLARFRKSRAYMLMNIFNIACFFVYLEIVLCFYGPCRYESHYAKDVVSNYRIVPPSLEQTISDVDVVTARGYTFNFVVRDEEHLPSAGQAFLIGSDFLLGKRLKGIFGNEDASYRLFSASPILLMSWLVIVISFVAFFNNLNQNAYSLMALTVLNTLTMLAILLI